MILRVKPIDSMSTKKYQLSWFKQVKISGKFKEIDLSGTVERDLVIREHPEAATDQPDSASSPASDNTSFPAGRGEIAASPVDFQFWSNAESRILGDEVMEELRKDVKSRNKFGSRRKIFDYVPAFENVVSSESTFYGVAAWDESDYPITELVAKEQSSRLYSRSYSESLGLEIESMNLDADEISRLVDEFRTLGMEPSRTWASVEQIMSERLKSFTYTELTEINKSLNLYRSIKFVRIGSVFILNEENYYRLSDGLRERIRSNVIVMKDLSKSDLVSIDAMKNYTVATIITMLNSDIKGKRVIDVGAGDGILSLVAARLGAKEVVLIENDPEALELARANIDSYGNEHDKKDRFIVIPEDLKGTDNIISQLPATDTDTVLISSIGTWPNYPGVTNSTSLALIPGIERSGSFVATVILGGYDLGREGIDSGDLYALDYYGFTVSDFQAKNYTAVSLIAFKKTHESDPTEAQVKSSDSVSSPVGRDKNASSPVGITRRQFVTGTVAAGAGLMLPIGPTSLQAQQARIVPIEESGVPLYLATARRLSNGDWNQPSDTLMKQYSGTNESNHGRFFSAMHGLGGVGLGLGFRQNFAFALYLDGFEGNDTPYVMLDKNPLVTEILIPFILRSVELEPTRLGFLSRILGFNVTEEFARDLVEPPPIPPSTGNRYRDQAQLENMRNQWLENANGLLLLARDARLENARQILETDIFPNLSLSPEQQATAHAYIEKFLSRVGVDNDGLINFLQDHVESALEDGYQRNPLARGTELSSDDNYQAFQRKVLNRGFIGVTGNIEDPQVMSNIANEMNARRERFSSIYISNGIDTNWINDLEGVVEMFEAIDQLPLRSDPLFLQAGASPRTTNLEAMEPINYFSARESEIEGWIVLHVSRLQDPDIALNILIRHWDNLPHADEILRWIFKYTIGGRYPPVDDIRKALLLWKKYQAEIPSAEAFLQDIIDQVYEPQDLERPPYKPRYAPRTPGQMVVRVVANESKWDHLKELLYFVYENREIILNYEEILQMIVEGMVDGTDLSSFSQSEAYWEYIPNPEFFFRRAMTFVLGEDQSSWGNVKNTFRLSDALRGNPLAIEVLSDLFDEIRPQFNQLIEEGAFIPGAELKPPIFPTTLLIILGTPNNPLRDLAERALEQMNSDPAIPEPNPNARLQEPVLTHSTVHSLTSSPVQPIQPGENGRGPERAGASSPVSVDENSDVEEVSVFTQILDGELPEEPRVVGEKAYNLMVLNSLEIAAPSGFSIIPDFYRRHFSQEPTIPEAIWSNQILVSLAELEKKTGKKFGGKKKPLIVSVRSNAEDEESMAGILDSISNIGINDVVVEGLAKLGGKKFAYDTYRRLLENYGEVVFDISQKEFRQVLRQITRRFSVASVSMLDGNMLEKLVTDYKRMIEIQGHQFPQNVNVQLIEGLQAVFGNTDLEKLALYRSQLNLSTDIAIGAIIQEMVFGNLNDNSASGIFHTRDVDSGKRIGGHYQKSVQGEDIMRGNTEVRLRKIAGLKREFSDAFAELLGIKTRLEQHYQMPQTLEFVIENGKLYVVQTKGSEMTAEAYLQVSDDFIDEGIIGEAGSLKFLRLAQERESMHRIYRVKGDAEVDVIAKSKYSTPGAQRGSLYFGPQKALEIAESGQKVVLFARAEDRNLDVLAALLHENIVALITNFGSSNEFHGAEHVRAASIPGLINLQRITLGRKRLVTSSNTISEGDIVVIDGYSKRLMLSDEEDILELVATVQNVNHGIRIKEREAELLDEWRSRTYEELLRPNVIHAQELARLREEGKRKTPEFLLLNITKDVVHELLKAKGKELGKSEADVAKEMDEDARAYLKERLEEEARQRDMVFIELERNTVWDSEDSPTNKLERMSEAAQIIIDTKYPSGKLVENSFMIDNTPHQNGWHSQYLLVVGLEVPIDDLPASESTIATLDTLKRKYEQAFQTLWPHEAGHRHHIRESPEIVDFVIGEGVAKIDSEGESFYFHNHHGLLWKADWSNNSYAFFFKLDDGRAFEINESEDGTNVFEISYEGEILNTESKQLTQFRRIRQLGTIETSGIRSFEIKKSRDTVERNYRDLLDVRVLINSALSSMFQTANVPLQARLKDGTPLEFIDKARLTSSPIENPGGIDMNPNNLNLQTQGGRFDFKLPMNSLDLQNIRIDGFTPVIINVAPLTNLPLLLGLVDEDINENDPRYSILDPRLPSRIENRESSSNDNNRQIDPGRDPMDFRINDEEEKGLELTRLN